MSLWLYIEDTGERYKDRVLWATYEDQVADLGVVKVHIPKGFISDGASVPWPISLLLPADGKYLFICIVHDLMYRKGMSRLDRLEADVIFRGWLIRDSIARWKRILLYLGVRLGGWYSFHRKPPWLVQNMETIDYAP